MTPSVWHLHRCIAQLQRAPLSAALDLSRPEAGLFDLRFASQSVAGAHVLGVALPPITTIDAGLLAEHYARGADLVATYRESESWPVRVEARWRAEALRYPTGPLPAIELVVSVRTPLWDSRPELSVETVFPPAELIRLADAGNGGFEPLGTRQASAIGRDGRPGCFVFRPRDVDLSYAEMVHPADFVEARLDSPTEPAVAVRLRHRLFPEPLEKGVIRRARVCGVFLRRSDDAHIAADCYARFATAEPPLGA